MNNSDKEDFAIIKRIFLGFILIGLSIKIGISNPLFSIMITPVLLPIICLGINFGLIKRSFKFYVIVGYVQLFLNDIFIRIYTGGKCDSEGHGFVSLSTLIAFIILSIGFRIVYNLEENNRGKKDNK